MLGSRRPACACRISGQAHYIDRSVRGWRRRRLVAGLLAGRLGPILGQTVIVENCPGGGTVIGTAAVARAKPDGYTILLVSAAHTINPHILKAIPYDALRDFTPISQLTRTAYILVTSQASKFRGIEDIATAGAEPDGQITFASSGTGSVPHLAGLLLSTLSGVRAVHIPYQGGAPALLGVLRGDVDIYFSSIVGARPFIELKRMRALGVSSDKRLAMLPDIPTMSEQGLRGFAIDGCTGLSVMRTSRGVIATLHAGIVRALAEPDLADLLKPEGEEIVGSNPQAFAALLREELAKYEAIVATAGLEPHRWRRHRIAKCPMSPPCLRIRTALRQPSCVVMVCSALYLGTPRCRISAEVRVCSTPP